MGHENNTRKAQRHDAETPHRFDRLPGFGERRHGTWRWMPQKLSARSVLPHGQPHGLGSLPLKRAKGAAAHCTGSTSPTHNRTMPFSVTSLLHLLLIVAVMATVNACGTRLKVGEYTLGEAAAPMNSAQAELALIQQALQVQITPPLDAPLRMIRSDMPEYEPYLLRGDITGSVYTEFDVLSDGSVGAIRIVQSSHRSLSSVVRRAMSRWRFAPPVRDGVAIPLTLNYSVSFKMED
jgi:TonB family protein